MKIRSASYLILATLIILTACRSTGQGALQKGRYTEACTQATSLLGSSPSNKKAVEALRQAYPLAINFTDKEVERTSTSNSADKDVQVYQLYCTMNKLAIDSSKSPAALKIIPDANYYNLELREASEKAADYYYKKASKCFSGGSKTMYWEAYYAYSDANRIRYNYKVSWQKEIEAKSLGTLVLLLKQEPVNEGYEINTNFFIDNPFKAFPPEDFFAMRRPEQLAMARVNPDYIVHLAFSEFSLVAVRQTSYTQEVARDSVVVGTYTDKRGRTHNVYATVKAVLTLTQLEMRAQVC